MKRILSGNEAIARGAWEAGVHVAAAYPGTPSTEILEELARFPHVYCEWSTNEKVAVDVAVGAAYAGRRALACMKHVGLNVAADSFFYVSFTGAEAGTGDRVGRRPGDALLAERAGQPALRPVRPRALPRPRPTPRSARTSRSLAFELSERFDTPVMLRTTTRINHSSTPVELGERRELAPTHEKFPRNPEKYVMVPANARKRHPIVEQRMPRHRRLGREGPLNRIEWRDRSVGIITEGVAYQYAREVFPTASILKLGMVYPLPSQLIRTFAAGVERLVVIEELDPVIEEQIRLLGLPCEGKSIFPLCGELDPTVVRAARREGRLAGRPRRRWTIRQVEKPELPARPAGALPRLPAPRRLPAPLQEAGRRSPATSAATRSGCCRRSRRSTPAAAWAPAIGVAHGAAKAGIGERMVAVIGDSTFYHTGMPALANVAYNKANILTIILDNRTTAMTGHQANPGTGVHAAGQPADVIELEPLVRALGIKHVATVDAYDVDEIEKAYKELMAHQRAGRARSPAAPASCSPRSASSGSPLEVARGEVHRLRRLLPHRLPGHPQERRRSTRRPASPWRSSTRPVHGLRGLRAGLPVRRDPDPRPDPPRRGGAAPRAARADAGEELSMVDQSAYNFVLVGVGGQGTLLASNILADVGLAAGFDAKKSEVHGMAQRGGSVLSHVRWHRGARRSRRWSASARPTSCSSFEKIEALRFAELLAAGRHRGGQRHGGRARSRSPSGKGVYPGDEHLARGVRRPRRASSSWCPASASPRRPAPSRRPTWCCSARSRSCCPRPRSVWWQCLSSAGAEEVPRPQPHGLRLRPPRRRRMRPASLRPAADHSGHRS